MSTLSNPTNPTFRTPRLDMTEDFLKIDAGDFSITITDNSVLVVNSQDAPTTTPVKLETRQTRVYISDTQTLVELPPKAATKSAKATDPEPGPEPTTRPKGLREKCSSAFNALFEH